LRLAASGKDGHLKVVHVGACAIGANVAGSPRLSQHRHETKQGAVPFNGFFQDAGRRAVVEWRMPAAANGGFGGNPEQSCPVFAIRIF
jgi:hypothetical protein